MDSLGRQHGWLHRMPRAGQQGHTGDPGRVSATSIRMRPPGSVACSPGKRGANMEARLAQVGRRPAIAMYADWTDRIQAGEYPMAAPPRPQGIERNVVVSLWDWADPRAYMHDLISTDKRTPPSTRTARCTVPQRTASITCRSWIRPRMWSSRVPLQVRDSLTPTTASTPPLMPSPYWGEEVIWDSQSVAHSFAMDRQARVGIAAARSSC